ncbi:hypothetical protein [Paenibacillus sp. N3.4]|uniref:hypothetical protein n=1 Tax=Paenibacillus sp. N3.4 TaxID=2603222 RepID=UPI0011C80E3B|nr:hypothetical protein [Paenibacillus sp. N3.4]TXK74468.1 hypothetical protein FU659_29300 [Paenibacillus sp. N3.4]
MSNWNLENIPFKKIKNHIKIILDSEASDVEYTIETEYINGYYYLILLITSNSEPFNHAYFFHNSSFSDDYDYVYFSLDLSDLKAFIHLAKKLNIS